MNAEPPGLEVGKKILVALIPERREHLGGVEVDGKLIFKWILQKCGLRMWAGFTLVRMGFSIGLFLKTVLNLRVS
jgi:hypothetical protein